MNNPRMCKRCLLADMSEEGLKDRVYQYIEGLSEDIKVKKEEYEHRLKQCRECEKLMNGMCRACGCFVEMRAAILTNTCPDVSQRW